MHAKACILGFFSYCWYCKGSNYGMIPTFSAAMNACHSFKSVSTVSSLVDGVAYKVKMLLIKTRFFLRTECIFLIKSTRNSSLGKPYFEDRR